MANKRDIVETVLLYIPTDKRSAARSLVTGLVERVVITYSNFRLWTWRNKYKDLTPASGSIYDMPNDCKLLDDTGAAPIDSNGDPNGLPYVHMTEKQYHRLRPADDTSETPLYYIPLGKNDSQIYQVRFWPNITDTTRVWYWRRPASTDIAHINNDMALVSGTLSLLSDDLIRTKKAYSDDFYNSIREEYKYDKRTRAKRLRIRMHPKHAIHNRMMREWQS